MSVTCVRIALTHLEPPGNLSGQESALSSSPFGFATLVPSGGMVVFDLCFQPPQVDPSSWPTVQEANMLTTTASNTRTTARPTYILYFCSISAWEELLEFIKTWDKGIKRRVDDLRRFLRALALAYIYSGNYLKMVTQQCKYKGYIYIYI